MPSPERESNLSFSSLHYSDLGNKEFNHQYDIDRSRYAISTIASNPRENSEASANSLLYSEPLWTHANVSQQYSVNEIQNTTSATIVSGLKENCQSFSIQNTSRELNCDADFISLRPFSKPPQ